MFNDDEPPVSLFSFQDIITSLTGIMIFFLLLLSLNILEVAQKTQDASPLHQELAQIKEKNKILQKHIDEISRDLKSYKRRVKNAQQKDESALVLERYRLEKESRRLKNLDRELAEQIAREKERLARLEKQNQQLRKTREEIEREVRQNQELTRQIEQKRQQIEKTRKMIERRRKEVQVTLDAGINKIPILIECSRDRICIRNTEDDANRRFNRSGPDIPSFLKEVFSYLKNFSPQKYYFVFLIKPSAAAYLSFLRIQFSRTMENADCGFEPILENEAIVNE